MPNVFYLGNPQFREFDTNGAPLAGGQLHTFEEGTATPKASYTDATGTVTAANPVVLDANGRASVWLDGKYKLRLDNSADVVQWTEDGVAGVGFVAAGEITDEWEEFTAGAPSFVDATNFSVAGDKTGTFQVGRRVRATVAAGTLYGRITVSAFTTVTTVTVVWDSGTLDSGLSAVAVGFISVDNPSVNWRAIDELEADFSKKGLNDSFATGTKMLFQQSTPPTGWTKDVTSDDMALRLVSGSVGSGGSNAFSVAFNTEQTPDTGETVLDVTQIPAHEHVFLDVTGGAGPGGGGGAGGDGNTSTVGGGLGHLHTNAFNLDVEFVDVVLATKD